MSTEKTTHNNQPSVTSFKGLTHEFMCRDFQFEVGKTYSVSGGVKACASGFHACESPIDVWGYYPVVDNKGRLTRYAEVEQSGATDRDGDKIASASITIKAELKFGDFIARAVKWLCEKPNGENNSNSGSARIGSSGDSARIVSEGSNVVIASAGADTIVTAKKGAWISLAEFSDGNCIGFATGCIEKDGTYKASGGILVEVQP